MNTQENLISLIFKKIQSIVLCCLWTLLSDRLHRGSLDKVIKITLSDLNMELEKYDLKQFCGLTLLRENRRNHFNDFRSVYDVRNKDGNNMVDGKYNFLQIAWMKPFVKIDIFPFDFIEDDKLDAIYDKFAPAQYRFYNDMLKNKVKFPLNLNI